MAQYTKSAQAPHIRARQKEQRRKIALENKRLRSLIFKRVMLIVFVFMLSIGFINQYSKIININSQINSLEKEIKQTDNLIDITEGKVLNTINWDKIESTAKGKLHMIEPDKDDYKVLTLKELPKNNDLAATNVRSDKKSAESKLSMIIKFLSE